MNVDSDNYGAVREYITARGLIEQCQHISFDLQFTGLRYPNNEKDRPFHLPYEKYAKMQPIAKKYNIIQIGLTFFVPEQEELVAYPFNFYVFPRESLYSDPVISLQAGCMEFNTHHEMDWNRWIRKGITYMKLAEYHHIREGNAEKTKSVSELVDFMDADCRLLWPFLLEAVNNVQNKMNVEGAPSSEAEVFIPRQHLFQLRRALEKHVQENELNLLIQTQKSDKKDVDKPDQDWTKILIIKITAGQKEETLRRKQEKLFGFTLFFAEIWNSGKSLIGHNCMFDLLFIYESFVDALPADYHSFKQALRGTKRDFYDTKFMAAAANGQLQIFGSGTSLQQIHKVIRDSKEEKVSIKLPADFSRYDLSNPALHEAGFDSYLTGWIFYQLSTPSLLKSITNKINLSMSYYHIDLQSQADAINPHTLVFYIQIAPPTKFVKMEDLRKTKLIEIKSLKDLLKKKDILKYVSVQEGFKELFVEVRTKAMREQVVKEVVAFVEDGLIRNISGLEGYFRARIIKERVEKDTADRLK